MAQNFKKLLSNFHECVEKGTCLICNQGKLDEWDVPVAVFWTALLKVTETDIVSQNSLTEPVWTLLVTIDEVISVRTQIIYHVYSPETIWIVHILDCVSAMV